MRCLLMGGALLLSHAAAIAAWADEPWRAPAELPIDQFIVQAHRGAGDLAEENTPHAFELGWSLGCVPEADIRQTSDGVIVPFHDSNFARVVKDADSGLAKKGVKDVTFAELQKLDVGSWKGEEFAGRRVVRLCDVFALMKNRPSRRLYLDIKRVDLAALADEVRQCGVERQVIFATTKYPLLREWKKLVPESETLLWIGGSEAALTGRFEELRATDFADVTQLQIHTHLAVPIDEIRRETVNPFEESDAFLRERGDELRRHGITYQTLPYGGSTKEVYWKLLDLGLMSFATDYPKVTWDAVKRYYADEKQVP